MRLKRSHAGVRVCALVSLVVLSVLALTVAPALALPPGRHYEMVSPVHKGGFGATRIGAVAPNGESVGFYSGGVFDEPPSQGGHLANYLARREASAWSTAPLGPPSSLLEVPAVDLSPTLSMEFAVGSPGPNVESPDAESVGLWLHPTALPDVDAGWEAVDKLAAAGQTEEPRYVTATPDFCHVVLYLFVVNRECSGRPASVMPLGVDNKGQPIDGECGVNFGDEKYSPHNYDTYNAISADGSELFFTVCPSGSHEENPESPHQLFVRVGGSRTLEVSRSLEAGAFGGCVGEGDATPGEVPCAGAAARPSADFAGASADGSTVYFTTTAQLTASDKDTGEDLYVASIGCPAGRPECQASEREVTSLTQASQDPNGGAAEVQGIVRVTPDGERAYFVAGGDLLTVSQQQALEEGGRPVPKVGAANLYVYDRAGPGSVVFVGELCTGRESSGTAKDIRCPSGGADTALWTSGGQDAGESQTGGPGGEFLVFSTYAQLTSDDTNVAKDVYRYDAQTGALSRVSIGDDGYDPNGGGGTLGSRIEDGHRGATVVEQYEMDNRAISEDGSRIVFTSAEPLSPSDTNGLVNAYEWHAGPGGGGSVSLVSTGSDPEGVEHVVISPDGSSVIFITAQGLVPQDTDGADDVYDARLGEGFPAALAERQPCEGDGCQGPLTNPESLLVPSGSGSQAPGGNAAPPPATVAHKPKPKSKLCKRGFVKKKNRCIKKAKAKKASRDRRTKS
jgi:hypothetical protein